LLDLTQPVDVYYDWIDACDAVAQEQNPQPASSQPAMPRLSQPKSRAGLAPGEKITAEDDGFIDDEGVEEEEDFREEE
jgi:transcription elongation factor Elf1